MTPTCGCSITPEIAPLTGSTARQGASSKIFQAGQSQIAIYSPVLGGTIVNPATAIDQGMVPIQENGNQFVYASPAMLYVSLGTPAMLSANGGTICLYPGQSFNVPVGCALPVYVNSSFTGHRFTAIAVQPRTGLATPYGGAFPAIEPTGKTTTIPSYLYKQYNDDPDLPAFIKSYNDISQTYVDWFNNLNLPIYTKLQNALLDWVAQGLYGIERPTLYSGITTTIGPFNTYGFNDPVPFNKGFKKSLYTNIAVTTDDTFKRILTWHLYRGDGRNPNIRWIKRRAARFLYGSANDNYDYNGDTSNISVSIAGGQIVITLILGYRKFTKTSAFNKIGFNTTAYNGSRSMVTSVTLPALAVIFEEAINTGALEMPTQYNTSCRIGIMGV